MARDRERQAVQPFFERRPFLHSLIVDRRILAIAEGLLGPDILLNVTEGNLHVGDTPWHGGSGGCEVFPQVKIAFHLEPLTRETGAIRFIPGSHKGGFSERLERISHRTEDPRARPWGVRPHELRSYYDRMTYSFHPATQNLESENPRVRALPAEMVEWGFRTQSV